MSAIGAQELVASRMRAVARWCVRHDQLVSANKTKAVLFCRDAVRKAQLQLALNETEVLPGRPLQWSDSFRYLGTTFQCDLSWSAHGTELVKKAKGSLAKLRRAVANVDGKCDGASRRTLANAVVLCHLRDSAAVWAQTDTKSQIYADCERVYRLASRWVLNCSAPVWSNTDVCAETRLLPFDLFCAKTVLKQFVGLLSKRTPIRDRLRSNWREDGLLESRFRKCCQLIQLQLDPMHIEPTDRKSCRRQVDAATQLAWDARWKARSVAIDSRKTSLQLLLDNVRDISEAQWKINSLRNCREDIVRLLLRLQPERLELPTCECQIAVMDWSMHLIFECKQLHTARETLRRNLMLDDNLQPFRPRDASPDDDLHQLYHAQLLLGTARDTTHTQATAVRKHMNVFLSTVRFVFVNRNRWYMRTRIEDEHD
jgi:hypothetical protein